MADKYEPDGRKVFIFSSRPTITAIKHKQHVHVLNWCYNWKIANFEAEGEVIPRWRGGHITT